MRTSKVELGRGTAIIITTLCTAISILATSCGGGGAITNAGTPGTSTPSLSPSNLVFASRTVGAATAAQTITLSNHGTADLSVTSIALSGTNASDFAQSNNCGATVAADASCTISITFKPAATGTRSASLAVTDNAASGSQTVVLSGSIATTVASVSPSSLALGDQPLSIASPVQAITLTNTGSADLSIKSVAVSGANPNDFTQSNNCGASVATGAHCTISVVFKPVAAGTRAATVVVADSAPSSPQTVPVSGIGDAPVPSFSAPSVAFGNQSVSVSSAPQAVTLTNIGNAPLNLSSIAVFGTNASDFAQTNNCGFALAAGANCTINVTFTPSAAGSRGAALAITDNATGSPQSVSLSGNGISTGANFSPSSVAFGNQSVSTASTTKTVTLSNSGNSVLTISSIVVLGTNGSDFAQTNNCGSSVAAGTNCMINITFTPAAAGSRAAALAITDNATGSPQSVALAGTGTASGVSVSPSSISYGNQSVGTPSTVQTLTLTNTGGAALTISSIAVLGTNVSDFAQTNNCGSSVAPGANCTINITFTPAAAGSRAAFLAITDNATGSPQAVSLSGTGTSTGANVSPTSVAFGNQSVGILSATHTITLTNSGNSTLAVSGIAVSGANASDYTQTNNCGSSVGAGASCSVSLTFKPAAAGARAGILAFTDNAAGSPQSVPLSGTGISTAATVSPTSVAFGNQSVGITSAAHTVTLTNSGNSTLTVSGIAVSGTNAGDFAQTNNCGSNVAAGTNCLINITFTPAASGSRAAALAITDNATGSPQAVSLSGTGTSIGADASPSSVAFGSQSVSVSSAAKTVTLTNTGNAPLNLSSIAFSGANASDYTQTNNCGASVAAGANCTINVTFTPAAAGSRAANLAITDNAPGSPQSVSLSGTGASSTSGVTFSPSNLGFSNQSIEMTSTAQTVTLTNTGTASLSITSFNVTGANSNEFVQNNNCGGSVAVGANCTIVVLFTPSDIGIRTAALSVADSATGSPQSVSLSGTGSHDVILTWTASPTSNISGYYIYRGTSSGAESATPLNSTPINATNFTDRDVTAGTAYFYRVTAVTSDGMTQSAASTEATATVPTT